MSDSVWSELHKKYMKQGLENKPNIFAETALGYFPKRGKLLDLGAGLGQDSRFFAAFGFEVLSTDLESGVLEKSKSQVPSSQILETEVVDLREPLPFRDMSFDVVYAHLSLHYFDSDTTQKIMDEIYRVLKPGGIVALLVNSVNDPEFGTGTKIEEEFFEVGNKMKRFFSIDSTRQFTAQFEVLLLDDQGETYKDAAAGVHNLIRFVGKKR